MDIEFRPKILCSYSDLKYGDLFYVIDSPCDDTKSDIFMKIDIPRYDDTGDVNAKFKFPAIILATGYLFDLDRCYHNQLDQLVKLEGHLTVNY